MTAHLPALVLAALSAWLPVSADAEIAAVAVRYGVPVAVALAVAETETGAVPAARRDAVVSKGNVGRFQVNATTWCPTLGLPRAACIRALQDRRTNIRVGVAVLARVQARYSPGSTLSSAHMCKCGGLHAGGWTAHYNGGTVVLPDTRPERYGLKVLGKVRKMTKGGDR